MKKLSSGFIKEVPLDNQCQKRNFYKIPEDFSFEDKKTIEKHWLGYVDDYYPKSMNKSWDEGKMPNTTEDLGGLLWFILYQVLRTPKFKFETLKKIDELHEQNPELEKYKVDFNLHLPYLFIKTFIPFREEVVPEFLIAQKGNWFITSDNPASFWVNTWGNKEYLPTILGTSFKKRNLEILCPLNPQVCLVLKLNQVKKEKYFMGIKRNCNPEEVKRINESIKIAADKIIFSFDQNTLK
jgi:hypothetical protein